MKTFYIKKEKWYKPDYLIYSEAGVVGKLSPERWKTGAYVSINNNFILIKRLSIWSDEKIIYSDDKPIGRIKNKAFKSYCIITLGEEETYLLRQKLFRNKFILEKEGHAIGEYRSGFTTNTLVVGNDVDDRLAAATLAQSVAILNSMHHTAATIPIYLILFT